MPGFWADPEVARTSVQEIKSLKNWLTPYDTLNHRLEGALEMAELLAADSPDLTQIPGLAERYGLQFGPPDWVSDLVSAYGLTPPS